VDLEAVEASVVDEEALAEEALAVEAEEEDSVDEDVAEEWIWDHPRLLYNWESSHIHAKDLWSAKQLTRMCHLSIVQCITKTRTESESSMKSLGQ